MIKYFLGVMAVVVVSGGCQSSKPATAASVPSGEKPIEPTSPAADSQLASVPFDVR